MKTLPLLFAFLGAFASAYGQGIIGFSDSSFQNDWTASQSNPSGSLNVVPQTTGGRGGPMLQTDFAANGTTNIITHLNALAFYTPSLQGAVTNISTAMGCSTLSPLVNGRAFFAPLVRQDGRDFIRISPGSSPFGAGSGWATVFINPLGIGTWTAFDGTGAHPNWDTGSTLQFGYMVSGGGLNPLSGGVDFWSMTIYTVPEPSTWALLLLGSAVAFTLRRRR